MSYPNQVPMQNPMQNSMQNPMRNQNPMNGMGGGNDQRRRMMLANMLQQQQSNQQPQQSSNGVPAAISPYQMLADSINNASQGYAYGGQGGGQGDGGQLNQGGTMSAGQPGDANVRGNIMKSFNGPSGGSQMGYELSAPMTAQRGMMGNVARAGEGFGSAMSGMGRGISGAAGGIAKMFA